MACCRFHSGWMPEGDEEVLLDLFDWTLRVLGEEVEACAGGACGLGEQVWHEFCIGAPTSSARPRQDYPVERGIRRISTMPLGNSSGPAGSGSSMTTLEASARHGILPLQ